MRSDANQGELALDAPMHVLLACRSEDQAVQICLALAERRLGRDQQTVALLCGWKSDSCLSEIANPRHSRKMPASRRDRFALATGCNLHTQFIAYATAKAASNPTERDAAHIAAAACMAEWGMAA